MREYIRNLSIFNKTVLFSTFVVILMGVGTAYISYHVQRNMTKDILMQQATGVSSFYSHTLNATDILKVENSKDSNIDANSRVKRDIQKVSNSSPSYLLSYVVSTKKVAGNNVKMLVVSDKEVEKRLGKKHIYQADPRFYEAYQKAIKTKKMTETHVYKDRFGVWTTSFAPIQDSNKEVVGVVGVSVDASILATFQRKLIASLIAGCIIFFTIIIFFQDWGLRKLMSPLRELLLGIQQVSKGNFQVRLRQQDASELGEISKQFNEMTLMLQTLFEQVAVTKENLGEKASPKPPLKGLEKAIDEMELIIEKTRLQKELQRAEKMNAIGQLAASVAHEIRNPMTVVKGFLQLFYAKDNLSDTEKGYIQLMIDEINRAEIIINDYLSLARPDVEQTEAIHCYASVNNLVELLSSYALLTNNINIEVSLNAKPVIRGVRNEFNQVLLNIMKNGIEAMKHGGTLKVVLEETEHNALIKVSDTGIGMNKEELERLGTPFYSLKEKGTGIGLMVSYQIIEKMKGKIQVQSQRGLGTTFLLEFPKISAEGERILAIKQ